MAASVERYGVTSAGQPVQRVTLTGGLRVDLLTYGALIARLDAPGRDGPANVVLGLPDLATYEAHNPSFGVTVGRYANRIRGGRFTLDGTEYRLTQNEGRNTLHGGNGFGKRVWRLADADAASATLTYRSADGEEGFPGALETTVRFHVDGPALRLEYTAQTDAPTVLNLTNHSYFNLDGEGEGDVLGHVLQVAAEQILELDAESLPTGRLLAVDGTPFDFRAPQPVGARIRMAHPQLVHGLGYDACFVLTGAGLREVSSLASGRSGRVMTVSSDQPAVQVYSGNKLTGALAGPSGRLYRSGDGIALETQHFPDSPNQPAFPSTMLRPGQTFRSETEYRFAVRSPLGDPATLG